MRHSSSLGAFLSFFVWSFLLFLWQVIVVVVVVVLVWGFFQKTKERFKFYAEKCEYFSWWMWWSSAWSTQEEWQYQYRRQMGREVWLVRCLPCSYRPQWRKVILLGEGQTKTEACSVPVKESKCAGLLAPSIHLPADGSMVLLHHLSQILSEGCYKKQNFSFLPQYWKFSSPIYLLWLLRRRQLHAIFHNRYIYNIYVS